MAFWLSSTSAHPRIPTALLLHGLGNSLYYWTAVAPVVANTTQVLAVDIPGFGKSSHPEAGFGLSAICDELWLFLEHVGATSVVLVGHSLGAYVALSMARSPRMPARSIALISAALFRAEALLRNPASAITAPALSIALVAQFAGGAIPFSRRTASVVTSGRYVRMALLWPFVAFPARLERDLVISALSGNSGRSITATLRLARTTSLAALGDDLPLPVALVWGDKDRLINGDDIRNGRTLFNPQSELCLRDCGHWPMLEMPNELSRFLAVEISGAQRDSRP